MKAKVILIPVLTFVLSACGGEKAVSSSYIPEATPAETQTAAPAVTEPAYPEDVEFIDAPETAPIIIDGDEEPLPETQPMSEIYQAAPDIMPETVSP